jgi:hypothetical protein
VRWDVTPTGTPGSPTPRYIIGDIIGYDQDSIMVDRWRNPDPTTGTPAFTPAPGMVYAVFDPPLPFDRATWHFNYVRTALPNAYIVACGEDQYSFSEELRNTVPNAHPEHWHWCKRWMEYYRTYGATPTSGPSPTPSTTPTFGLPPTLNPAHTPTHTPTAAYPYPNIQAYHTHCYQWYLPKSQCWNPNPTPGTPPGDIIQFHNLMTTGTPAGPNLPVWLTEFGVVRDYIVTLTPGPYQTPTPGPCGAVTPSDLEAQDLAAWTEWLEKTDWIERYAYFMPRGAPGSAFWPDDYTFSHLMYPEGCAFRNAGQVGRYSAQVAVQDIVLTPNTTPVPMDAELKFTTMATQQAFYAYSAIVPMANVT